MAYKKTNKQDNDQAMLQLLFGDEPDKPTTPTQPQKNDTKQKINAPEKPKILTVSDLTAQIRLAIKNNLPGKILVAGEISNFTHASSGHFYFTLKDPQSQISCAMWRSKAKNVKFQIEDGMAVQIQGSIDIYGPRGQYQLYAEKITPDGMGALELAFQQLKEKLDREGLFNAEHKKAIPKYPLTIAVITSPTGAAIRDIIRTLELRWPVGNVLLYPVAVQGQDAKGQITAAINELNAQADKYRIDVILLGRGGGSLEDLWAFNEEIVARAVHKSKIPIICGVGHESDVTIAELIADLRAATPTAAAELASPMLSDVASELSSQYNRLKNTTLKDVTIQKGRLSQLAQRAIFKNPVLILRPFAQHTDETAYQLSKALETKIKHASRATHNAEIRLSRISPRALLTKANFTIASISHKLKIAIGQQAVTTKANIDRQITRLRRFGLNEQKLKNEHKLSTLKTQMTNRLTTLADQNIQKLANLEARLNSCNHKQVLKRGFSIARRKKDSKIVTSYTQLSSGETILTELADGTIISDVKDALKNDSGA